MKYLSIGLFLLLDFNVLEAYEWFPPVELKKPKVLIQKDLTKKWDFNKWRIPRKGLKVDFSYRR